MFLFVFPGDRRGSRTAPPSDDQVFGIRSRFNRSTLGGGRGANKPVARGVKKPAARGRRAAR